MITIYHNLRCSKSRETLALLDSLNKRGEPVQVVEYLKTPLTVSQLKTLHRQLGRPLRDMVRDNETEFKEWGLNDPAASEAAIYAAIAEHPILLQRPIVVVNDKAAIGRPPESVAALFE
ncbi:MAG: arsenate reductase (glutaredoxin) [Burkholderia sp.]